MFTRKKYPTFSKKSLERLNNLEWALMGLGYPIASKVTPSITRTYKAIDTVCALLMRPMVGVDKLEASRDRYGVPVHKYLLPPGKEDDQCMLLDFYTEGKGPVNWRRKLTRMKKDHSLVYELSFNVRVWVTADDYLVIPLISYPARGIKDSNEWEKVRSHLGVPLGNSEKTMQQYLKDEHEYRRQLLIGDKGRLEGGPGETTRRIRSRNVR